MIRLTFDNAGKLTIESERHRKFTKVENGDLFCLNFDAWQLAREIQEQAERLASMLFDPKQSATKQTTA